MGLILFLTRRSFVTTILFVVFVFAFHSSYAQQSIKEGTISERKFQKLMEKDNATIIDVRTEKEYSEGHIPNAQNIDVQKEDFTSQIESLGKSKTYLLYCRSGKRSQTALNILKEKGFEKVYHLKGGFIEWNGMKE